MGEKWKKWRDFVGYGKPRPDDPIVIVADGRELFVFETSRWGFAYCHGSFVPYGFVGSSWRAIINEGMETVLKKSEQARMTTGKATAVRNSKFAESHPALFDHMTQVTWDDGTPRKPSSLTVFVQDGSWKAILKDKEAGLCLWVAAGTFEELMKAVNAGAADPASVWRVDRQEPGQTASRVKK